MRSKWSARRSNGQAVVSAVRVRRVSLRPSCIEKLGVKVEHDLVDTKGVVFKGRKEGMNPYKEYFATDGKARTLAEAMKTPTYSARVGQGILSQDMVKSMAPNPIFFAMANPDPEITYEDASRPGTNHHGDRPFGLSEPGEQRSRIPVHLPRRIGCARNPINDEMKSRHDGVSKLAKEDVPDSVLRATADKRSSSTNITLSQSPSTRAFFCGWHRRLRRPPWKRASRSNRSATLKRIAIHSKRVWVNPAK